LLDFCLGESSVVVWENCDLNEKWWWGAKIIILGDVLDIKRNNELIHAGSLISTCINYF
jgi:hypothetical protein